MICPRCQAENPTGMRFCGRCGAALAAICRSCGASNPPENKFCGQCATPLGEPAAAREPGLAEPAATGVQPGELKQVTVLFCDLVDSTGLAERVGAEALHELLRRFLDTAAAEVQRYGGTVPQFLGDGFMALFGAPVAHEDHVRRALLAALAILRTVSGGVGGSGGGPSLNLPIRIGIDTGLVVFGAVADTIRFDPTAVGDTANVAARLQGAAAPRTILIGETTRQLAQGYAEVEAKGPLALKGKTGPIAAYRLLGVSQQRFLHDQAMAFAAESFVDRDSELAFLGNILRQIEAGHGQIIGIAGEPGIGKSRLVAEFRRSLADHRVTWVEGRCVSYGTAIPYLLVLELLRSNCRIVESDTPAAIAEKVRSGLRAAGLDADADSPFLQDILGIDAGPVAETGLSPEALKTKTFEILRQLSIKGSQRRPLVLAVEDLQWVDALSQEFLEALSDSLPGARILVLATYRPTYRPPWIDKSYAGQIALQPLSHEDSLRVVGGVLDRKRLAADLAEAIADRAEGNPLFLEQLALHAGEEAALRSRQTVPATIRDVVTARIDRLPEETKRLLQIAAVIGREFSFRLLSEVWQGEGPLEPRLRELMRLEFLHERLDPEETVYVFGHALTEDAAYAGQLARQRRAGHARVGRALEAIYRGRADEVAELLALHYGRSDDAEKAVDYAILAAEKAQRRWANSDALGYFDDALDRLDAMADSGANRLRRIDAVMKQVEIKLASGRHAEHMAALSAIRGVVEETDDPQRRAAWHYWMGFLGCLTGGPPAAAIEHCREAAAIAAAAGFDELDGFIASTLAQAYVVAGELRAAIEAGERALSLFERHGNLAAACRALWHLSSAANQRGEWEASLAYCRRALDHGIALDDRRLRAVALWRTGFAQVLRGDSGHGIECCDEALALEPIAYDLATARMVRGYGMVRAGRIAEGIAELAEVVAWFAEAQLPYIRSLATLLLAGGHLAQGDRTSAQPLIEEALTISQQTGYVHYEALAHRLMGECLAAEMPAAADEHIERALQTLDRIGARNDFARTLVTRARLWQEGGDPAGARQLFGEALAIFEKLGTSDEAARVKAALADLAAASG